MKVLIWGFTRGEGTIECACDNLKCNTNFDYEFDNGYPDWKDCQDKLKTYGWISRKIDGEWYDFCCPECYQEYLSSKKE